MNNYANKQYRFTYKFTLGEIKALENLYITLPKNTAGLEVLGDIICRYSVAA